MHSPFSGGYVSNPFRDTINNLIRDGLNSPLAKYFLSNTAIEFKCRRLRVCAEDGVSFTKLIREFVGILVIPVSIIRSAQSIETLPVLRLGSVSRRHKAEIAASGIGSQYLHIVAGILGTYRNIHPSSLALHVHY